MAPKAKKGGGGGRTFRETPTEAHVAALELRAQVAEAAALELREAHLSAHNALVAEREALRGREGELEDVYSYVDTQMLHSARERHAYEKKIREAEEERAMAAETAEKEEEEARRAADATATALREELAQKQAELDALVVFRERQPVLEGELAELRQLVAHQQATQREREHELNVRAWKQREALNEEMLSRIAQAKENFLDLTDSMLDKTAQRTIQRNAMVEEELDVQGGFLRRAIDDNDQLRAKGAALKRELGLLRQQGTAEVRRSVAHRQLAVAAAAQHDALATALDDARAEAEASAARERRARDELAKAHAQLDASRRQCAALASALRDARDAARARRRPRAAADAAGLAAAQRPQRAAHRRRRRRRGRRRRSGAAAAAAGRRRQRAAAATRPRRATRGAGECGRGAAGMGASGTRPLRRAARVAAPRRRRERAAGAAAHGEHCDGRGGGSASLGGVLPLRSASVRGSCTVRRPTTRRRRPPPNGPRPPPPPPRAAGRRRRACRRRARAARSGRGAAEGSIGRCRPLAPAGRPRHQLPLATAHRARARRRHAARPPRAVAGSAGVALRAPRAAARGGGRRRRRRRRRRLLSDVVDDGDGEPPESKREARGRRD